MIATRKIFFLFRIFLNLLMMLYTEAHVEDGDGIAIGATALAMRI
jgi:hypothetical protein